MGNRAVADGVLDYTPAYLLWSDGLSKSRFLYVPKGTKIDATNATAWKFPVGTRVWKEFRSPDDDHAVETRIYLKTDDSEWRHSTYEWNGEDAKRVDSAKNVNVGSLVHWLPGPNDCEDCHKGRRDRLLGFEQVSLGLENAQGATLADLMDRDLLEGFSGSTSYSIGPPGEEAARGALGWLHVNCGITCHNENTNSTGSMNVDMNMRLDPAQLDGRSTADFNTVKSTVGVATQAINWRGKTRISPGAPDQSWLYTLITQRGDKMQMPPIATNVVDQKDADTIKQWILGMPKAAP
jgi:hypothetical protein